MLYFDSHALSILLALLGVLHIVLALPSGLRPEEIQNTTAEIDIAKVKRTDPTGVIGLCGIDTGLPLASCNTSSKRNPQSQR